MLHAIVFSTLLSDCFHDDPSVPHNQSQNQNPPKFPTCTSADGDNLVSKSDSTIATHTVMSETNLMAVVPVVAPCTAVKFPQSSPR